MPKISNKQYAQALYEITLNVEGNALDTALKTFVELLVSKHKLKQAYTIIDEFIAYSKKQEGIVELEIISARTLDETTVRKIKEVFGKKVEAIERIDESLISGVQVKMEDKILDGSIKTQLKTLKNSLTT